MLQCIKKNGQVTPNSLAPEHAAVAAGVLATGNHSIVAKSERMPHMAAMTTLSDLNITK